MLFSSIPFLFYFLPAILLVYFVVPRKAKNLVLLIFSLIFYAWGEPKNVFVMLVAIVSGYVFGLLMERLEQPVMRKVCLILSVGISLGMLGYFKYAGFFMENVEAITGLSVVVPRIALPIGISFYTFQILSYDIDVYRKQVPAQHNIIDLATYVALFPQLIAGPIVRYTDINEQLKNRTHTVEKVANGARRFVFGLSKKILLANTLGELCSIFRGTTEASVLYYWVYAIAFTLHIYFDFSGYSDMAIGLGKIFGFEFLENFDYPYISGSITEFWRRWHMSLGSWFRDYVYIPLGGNRCSKLAWFRNIFVVWMLTGLWHGADWNFVIWGLMFAVLLVFEKLVLLQYLKKAKVWNHIYVMFFVILSFVIFNAESLQMVKQDILGLFGALGQPIVSGEVWYELRNYGEILLLGILFATPLPKYIGKYLAEKKAGKAVLTVLEPVVLVGLLVIVTAYLVDGSYNPFLYFRF